MKPRILMVGSSYTYMIVKLFRLRWPVRQLFVEIENFRGIGSGHLGQSGLMNTFYLKRGG
jgi:hypothetical protein